jgi:hypothetical protein
MNLVYAYAGIALLATVVAYMTGTAGGSVFWLYLAGAILFAIAALGQYFKLTQPKK